MSHGVIVGSVAIATTERLVLGDGTELPVSGPLPPNLAAGMMVKVVYHLVNGARIPVSTTLLSDR